MKITALLLLMLLFFTSCTGGGQSASTSGGDITTSGSEEITSADQTEETTGNETYHPILKKTSVSKDDIVIGMSFEEYRELVSDQEDSAGYYGYRFLIDKDGNSLVVKFDGYPYKVVDMRSYPKRDSLPTHADFEKITKGMSLYEVIEYIGLPLYDPAISMICYGFLTEDGSRYIIFFSPDMEAGIVRLDRD